MDPTPMGEYLRQTWMRHSAVLGLAALLVAVGCGEGGEQTPEPDTSAVDTVEDTEVDTGGPTGESNCLNGEDDDGDDKADCLDDDCVGESCRRGTDATCDEMTQCGGGETGTECTDGTDNDGDQLTDCDDPDCGDSCACDEACDETCGNDKDDDADGVTDETCPCNYDDSSDGVCKNGTISPKNERCLKPEDYQGDERLCDQNDNDCDGVVDEGCPCSFDGQATGVCAGARRGTSVGNDGMKGECLEPGAWESDESLCDARDNDCDGTVDENCSACDFQGTSDGVCQFGQIDQSSGDCLPPTSFEGTETACDGLDNDCDGAVDENCPCNFNSQSVGVCATATSDDQGNCTEPDAFESDETTCDAIDNDCDGTVDENCTICPFNGTGTGVCAFGDASGGSCNAPAPYENDETKCDRLDNDCDGTVDEGCGCPAKGSNLGVCGRGSFDPSTGRCQVPTSYEMVESSCGDMQDNDCDGAADCQDPDCSGTTCGATNSGTCQSGVCQGGEQTCDDQIDNDTDGLTDCLDPDCSGDSCGPNSNGTCDAGGCQGGEASCDDQIDNDADGRTDCLDPDCESMRCGQQTPGQGFCRMGRCLGGETDCSDGVDNDADGAADCGNDQDCHTDPNTCPGGKSEIACANGLDDDSDGAVDCADSECSVAQGCGHIVFVTSKRRRGRHLDEIDPYTDKGLPLADFACQRAAEDANLKGEWKAILATDRFPVRASGAQDRITLYGPIFNNNGRVRELADPGGAFFDGSRALDAGLAFDEDGNELPSDPVKRRVWTATAPDGSFNGPDCNDWNGAVNKDGTHGIAPPRGSGGTVQSEYLDTTNPVSCGARNRLYCINGQRSRENCGTQADDDRDGAVNCDDPDCRFKKKCSQFIFVSPTSTKGDLGGLSGADQKCQNLAQNSQLPDGRASTQACEWKALLGTESLLKNQGNIRDRLQIDKSKRIFNMRGETMFSPVSSDTVPFTSNTSDTKVPFAPPDFDERGRPLNGVPVWTGLTRDGNTAVKACSAWTDGNGSPGGKRGNSLETNSNWVNNDRPFCDQSGHIYCIDGQQCP